MIVSKANTELVFNLAYNQDMFVGINHVTIIVQDKIIAEDFYFNKLGVKKVIVGKSLWAKIGQQFIHISENRDSVNQKTFSHFAIEVKNSKSYIQDLIKKGLNVFDFDDHLNKIDINQNLDKQNRCFFIEDPFDNMIEIVDSSNFFFKGE